MPGPAQAITVHPKPGVKIYLPGGTHGFSVAVPMHPEHAKQLGRHVVTDAERQAAAIEPKARKAPAEA